MSAGQIYALLIPDSTPMVDQRWANLPHVLISGWSTVILSDGPTLFHWWQDFTMVQHWRDGGQILAGFHVGPTLARRWPNFATSDPTLGQPQISMLAHNYCVNPSNPKCKWKEELDTKPRPLVLKSDLETFEVKGMDQCKLCQMCY